MSPDQARLVAAARTDGWSWVNLARHYGYVSGEAMRKQYARATKRQVGATPTSDRGDFFVAPEPAWEVSYEIRLDDMDESPALPPLQYDLPGPVKALVIPDLQVRSGIELDHIRWAGQYAAHIKADVIVQLGDWTDYGSISTYNTPLEREGMRLADDHAATIASLELFQEGLGEYRPKLQILTLGNHEDRLRRFIEDHPELAGTLKLPPFEDYGWTVYPFLQPVEVNGVMFAHYFTRTAKGWAGKNPHADAQTMTRREMRSCVAGHSPSLGTYIHPTLGGLIRGMIAGSYYQHDEGYQGPQGNRCWQGVVVLHELKDGMYSLMEVSLDYLKKRYSK